MLDYQRSSAFTLIELIIVITLIGILTAIGLTRYGPVAENARGAEAWSVLSQIMASENVFRVENNAYTNVWANLDRFDAAPVSTNFTFNIPNVSLILGYAEAARSVAAAGRNSYGICFASGRRRTCPGVGACNPGCP